MDDTIVYLITNGVTIITIILVVAHLLSRRPFLKAGAEERLTALLKTDIQLTDQHKVSMELLMTQQTALLNLMIKSIDAVNESIQTTAIAVQELTRATAQTNQDIQIVKTSAEKNGSKLKRSGHCWQQEA